MAKKSEKTPTNLDDLLNELRESSKRKLSFAEYKKLVLKTIRKENQAFLTEDVKLGMITPLEAYDRGLRINNEKRGKKRRQLPLNEEEILG